MNIEEYQKVKQMTYLHYCDYLQDKYGVGRADYMTKTSTRIQKYRVLLTHKNVAFLL